MSGEETDFKEADYAEFYQTCHKGSLLEAAQ